jgi:hypothetical protein
LKFFVFFVLKEFFFKKRNKKYFPQLKEFIQSKKALLFLTFRIWAMATLAIRTLMMMNGALEQSEAQRDGNQGTGESAKAREKGGGTKRKEGVLVEVEHHREGLGPEYKNFIVFTKTTL